ncbi:MAG TPA: DNA gyrase modulator, partial [Casimicrobiaceae bacterium]|nr:DNA gyrase modulator [Casimicrobiaceae bacterium]
MTDTTLSPLSSSLQADAERLLLAPADLDLDKVSHALASVHSHDVDFADFYFQHSTFESWSLEEGIVKAGTFSIDRGVGVRAVSGDKQAFAYSDDISSSALHEAAVAVRAIGRQGQSASAPLGRRAESCQLYGGADPVMSLQDADNVSLLTRLERKARARDSRVVQVMASLAGEHETIL